MRTRGQDPTLPRDCAACGCWRWRTRWICSAKGWFAHSQFSARIDWLQFLEW